MYPPDKLNIHPGDNHVARRRLRSFRIPSYNCVRQRNDVQFCRVPAMVPPERHQTPDWRALPSNGAAERMVQSFKQSLKKSKLPPRPALQEFLIQYRRTPLNTVFSHSQLLNGRQLRTKIDALLPSPAHIAQEHQAREATKSQQKKQTAVQHVRTAYDVSTPCYALYCGPRQTSTPRWVPASITRVHDTRTFTVKVHPREPLWKRHLEHLEPRYGVADDADPGVVISEQSTSADRIPDHPKAETLSPPTEAKTSDHALPKYGRHNPRRSSRHRKTRQLYNAS